MPSLDHCVNSQSEMTTLTKTLEVFDTYKHRDDKDSDEESFHLPLDDDESDSKVPDTIRNGSSSNDTEEEILNKFDSTPAALDTIDSQLEDRLLNDDEEEDKRGNKDEQSSSEPTESLHNGISLDEKDHEDDKDEASSSKSKDKEDTSDDTSKSTKEIDTETPIDNEQVEGADFILKEDELNKVDGGDKNITDETNDVPKLVEESNAVKEATSIDGSSDSVSEACNADKSQESEAEQEQKSEERKDSHNDDKRMESCDNSNDSSKNNDDSEALFDISIIRDAEEDNAESAYNEAHAEDNQECEEFEDRNEEKMAEDRTVENSNNEDGEDEEMDCDKMDDHLKSDEVDIEEDNLKLDCDANKDSGSDGECESIPKADSVENSTKKQSSEANNADQKGAAGCRLDEITGNLIDVKDGQINTEEDISDNSKNSEDTQNRNLKRPLSGEVESVTAKKQRTSNATDVVIKEVEKPKEKLPLRNLLSLSDFMKTKKNTRRLNMHDLEEFCLQKICEVIVHKSELGDVHHQLKVQEQLIETMRKEIQQLTKQARDLEIVNKKLLNDLKQQTSTQKPLNPLKITRSVGLQVKFTPNFEANLKRRQSNGGIISSPKVAPQQTFTRSPRAITNVVTPPTARQVVSPQKPQQQLPKPTTPLLSQALQNRRSGIADTSNKITINQTARPKPAEPKRTPTSASVIDLTDEDDKKDKNKNISTQIVPSKNIAVPLRTTPMRVNTNGQGIRLATSQGKVCSMNSVVTSSTPQLMYVVQSAPQNVLTPVNTKTVLVNFHSNGVLTSALNGSAVSVIPKQSNTLQLKTVTAATKTMQNNKLAKLPSKHPAPLPPPPVVRVNSDKSLKPIPPKPHLTIRKTETGIILQWKMPYELEMYEVIASYQLYAYQETSAMPSTDMWRKVGDVKALALPMACTLTQFADKFKYYFAVRPVDIHKRIGMFSEPEEISLL